jgi:protein SCO1/2
VMASVLLIPSVASHAGEDADDRALSSNPSLSVIGKAPAFTLLDTSGKTVRLADYRGQVVLLAFVFTSCPGVCPMISRQMALLQGALKEGHVFGREASMVSVTVDPETDTAPVLETYANSYGADPSGWKFLRETPEKIKVTLKAYDEWTRRLPKGDLDHPARVYLVDPNGNIREIYSLAFFNEKQARLDILALLQERK